MKPESKRHHYIPQFILRNFQDENSQVSYWDIEKGKLEKRNTKRIFMNMHMYRDEINHQESVIEGLCMKLLLQQQPIARDLRVISSALKMITDMERIGDHAADISEITIILANNKYIKKLEHIQQMAKETTVMVVNSIDAFVNKDAALAQKVIDQDDVVDELFVTIKRDLLAMINENIENGEQAMDLLMVAKYFERIGDHAVNIAELVIYSITGKHKK